MNTSFNFTKVLTRVYFTLFSILLSIVTFAQETKSIDVDINKSGDGGFMGSPWMWVIGIAVFILLLVALLRGGRKGD